MMATIVSPETKSGRYLVSTADERTWPIDRPVLFLGEWCRLYNRKPAWKNLDVEVVPYHWNDRKKLHRDYLYLQTLYEQLLRELARQLNTLHSVTHSLRYWRILTGNWLGNFVQVLFDRWAMIERVVNDYSVAGVRVLNAPLEQTVPNDMDHFNRLMVDDPWNEAIYAQLLQDFTSIPVETIPIHGQRLADVRELLLSSSHSLPLVKQLKSRLSGYLPHLSKVLCREDESFFLSSYMPLNQDFLLQWRLGQIPKRWRSFPTPKVEVDWTKRQWRMDQSSKEAFPSIIRAMISRQIPTLYLEGYDKLREFCATVPWPKKPRLIFTSNAHSSDDIFKAWAAAKIEEGASLVVGQHGGNYGAALWCFLEDHECAISDTWLSWGWVNGSNKVKPVCNLKMVGRRLGWDPHGFALMVEMTMPRFSYHMFSGTVASQWLSYFEDQTRFVAALSRDLRQQLLVRLYNHDYGWCQKQRWQDRFPEIHLNDGATPIESLMKKSRLCISTFNSTTFLESLAMNIPTIMFWNQNHWELRDAAIPYFNRLKEAGILYSTPESAATKAASVWDDVPGWWNQKEIQEARQYFCDQFSRTADNPIQILKQTLTTMRSAKN